MAENMPLALGGHEFVRFAPQVIAGPVRMPIVIPVRVEIAIDFWAATGGSARRASRAVQFQAKIIANGRATIENRVVLFSREDSIDEFNRH